MSLPQDPMMDTFEREVSVLLAPAAAADGRPGGGQPDPHQPAGGHDAGTSQPAGLPQPAGQAPPVAPSGRSPARLAYWFYGVAATGAVIGQTWVAAMHLPWAASVPGWLRVAAVAPFAVCLELLAMALAAMADERMRLGERAYGFRTFSAVVAAVAVGIQVAGHWPQVYWSGVFGLLSGSAYLLWLLHSAARRRDALRAAGKLADTAPAYGLWRRLRHPVWTARAAELAREGRTDPATGAWRPLGLYESLRAARLAMGDERRRPAVARAVEQVVRADQRDPRMAEVAVRTLDLDRLAAELAARVDYGAWADRMAPAITAPAPAASKAVEPRAATPAPADTTARTPADTTPLPADTTAGTRADATALPALAAAPTTAHPATAQPTAALVPAPRGRSTAERVSKALAATPDAGVAEVAAALGLTERTVRRYWPIPNRRTTPARS